MNTYKKWFKRVIISSACCVLLIGATNYLIDPYGIFRSDFSKQLISPNEHFIKVRYITKSPDKFDSFLFGSSRVNNIDVSKLKNGKWYNMAYSEGIPHEHLTNISFMLKSGVKIRNIMLGLDEFSYTIDRKAHLSQLLRQPYPPVIGESASAFYFRYIFRYPDMKIFRTIIRQYQKAGKRKDVFADRYDFYNSGQGFAYTQDNYIEKNTANHINDPKFSEPFKAPDGGKLNDTINDIREIVELLRINNINLIVFINPIHKTTYLNIDQVNFAEFKKELRKITGYYDFSKPSSITRNNYYFYETNHFRPIVGDMMLQKMFGMTDIKIRPDFGEFVINPSLFIK